jgi:hypothetical protein
MLDGIIYTTADGRPRIHVSASDEALLLAQVPPSGEALLPVEEPPLASTFDQMLVVEGELVAKAATTITATPNPFDADGVTECAVSVSPFVACTLRVNGTTYALTTGDPTLTLTSDVPATFLVSLDWLATHWAPSVTVTAEAP